MTPANQNTTFILEICDEVTHEANLARITIITIAGRAMADASWFQEPTAGQLEAFKHGVLPAIAKHLGFQCDRVQLVRTNSREESTKLTQKFFGGGVG